jgi:hypothetical protein
MVAPHSICLTDWLGKCFNFMDGINGITILYALTIISFALLPYIKIVYLLITMGLSCVVFGVFNVKKSHLLEM